MNEYIWVGAKTGKIAKDNHEGLHMLDLSEGGYDLYRKCNNYTEQKDRVCVINWIDDFKNKKFEVYMDDEKAEKRFNELKTLLNVEEVNTLTMNYVYIADYKEATYVYIADFKEET